MELAFTLSGGAPVLKRYQAGTTLTVAGIPLRGAGGADVDLASVEPYEPTTILTEGSVGLSLDTTGTISATADNADTLVTVIVNPDAVIRAKMSGSSTVDTALSELTPSAADATGVLANVTSLDDSAIWGFSGNNKGQVRRCDDVSGGVSISFDSSVAVTDRYVIATGYPCCSGNTESMFFDLTTDLSQIDSSTASADPDNFTCFDIQARTEDEDGLNNSFYLLVQTQNQFSGGTLVA